MDVHAKLLVRIYTTLQMKLQRILGYDNSKLLCHWKFSHWLSTHLHKHLIQNTYTVQKGCWLEKKIFLPLDPLAAVLLVAKRSQIIANRINLRPPLMSPVVSGSSIVTVDFDRVTSRMFWADASQKKIWSAYRNGTDRREVRKMKALSK